MINQINDQSIIPSTDVIQITLTLTMTTAQVVKMSVTVNNKSPIQDYVHQDDHTQPTFEMTPGFKPFTNKELTQSQSNLQYSLIQVHSNEFFQQMLLQNQPKFIITIICYNNTFMLPLDVQASPDTNTIKQTINKNINDLPEKFSGLKTCLNI